ncbi:putative RNA polymerase II transcriptional coactivator [Neolecta irregularis DAH-3]|uniref:Putative RNA polymerase II transcriptional coactivator n=1 Tax=Neolecta irregularis (strain DAH-3) TaxID=1198029 RepID=A0A1U7LS02_NEOID|nr:putative RNA polymerase II transcriptional coactivator [Neolecta irregularis DAH-3]|eukprot:OLL25445.1 putative RNA polymerase II transcriptional coactivator [Neolecta irregularis DAH-3]
MPPRKRAREQESNEEADIFSDQEAATSKPKLGEQKDSDGHSYWEVPAQVLTAKPLTLKQLSRTRRVGVSIFNKKTYVNIREYYQDKKTGKMMPGKKGIMLTIDQWKSICDLKDNIDSAIANIQEKE